jgi:type IV pilus assembly protein PilB
MDKQRELLEVLQEENKIKLPNIDTFLAEAAGKPIEDVLLKKRMVNGEDLASAKARIYDLPYIDLSDKEVSDMALSTISGDVSDNYRVVCFERVGDRIKVGLTDPGNFKALEAVDFIAKGSGLYPQYYLISEDSYKKALSKSKTMDKELSSAIKLKEDEISEKPNEESEEGTGDVEKSAPVVKIVSVIIRHAVEGGASDIHIEPISNESRVRYRIDGVLHTSLVLPINIHPSIVARIKVMANLKLDETRIPQDGRIRMRISDKEIDFRVSTLPLVGQEKVVMRILDTTRGAPKLEDLGFQGEQLKIVKNNIKKTEGLLLVTGPTGSGKSTTLFSVLEMLNQEGVNISTLEDPVEYQIRGVNQSQVKPEIHYTFASGLRSFLRQDPDVIMVGEIRDEETAELAVHAALTGHSVLSTLHTISALGAVSRLIDMKVEPFLLSTTLHTLIAQRLARKICADCREDFKIPSDYLEDVNKELDVIGEDHIRKVFPEFDRGNLKFYRGKGCARCGKTGYRGRVAICEVIDVNDLVREMICEAKKNLTIKKIKETQDFISMKQDGIIKILQGKTTIDEVLRVMRN